MTYETLTQRYDEAHQDQQTLQSDKPVVSALMQTATEDNVALAFVERHRDQYIFIHGRGKWYRWDGTRWALDVVGEVRNSIRNLTRQYNVGGAATPAKASFIEGVQNLLKYDPACARNAEKFDADNYLLNCPDGTYNLQTGSRQPHSPLDCLTTCTSVSPSCTGGERFKKFLAEITLDDKELEVFLQRALGACLSGAVEEHWLMFWIGGGRNGKNTLGDAVLDVLGDYARTVPSSTLMSQRHQAHPTEIMNLKGMRMVASGEIEEGAFWAEAKIKELTGDEYLNGHWMKQDWISFRRTHKHLIYGNYRPQLRNIDRAIKNRLKIVPFNACFDDREDPNLPNELKKERLFILQWLLEGHRLWMANGKRVGTCEAVERESEDYFESQSTVDSWLIERCRKEPANERSGVYWDKASSLFKDYEFWKKHGGEQPMGQTRFSEQMGNRFTKIKSNGVRYEGIKLKHVDPCAGYEN